MDTNQNPTPSREYRKQSIIFNEGMIELHHNPLITKKCYLIRFSTYDVHNVMNLSEKELLEIGKDILEFIVGPKND